MPKEFRGAVTTMLDSEGPRFSLGVSEQKRTSDLKEFEGNIKSQIQLLDDDASALARGGGVGTTAYREKQAQIKTLYQSLADNPDFNVGQDQANIALKRMYPRDEYQFVTPIMDASNIATTLTANLLALTVPNGVKTKVKLRFMFRSPATTNSCLVYDPAKGILEAGGADEGGVVGTPQVADGYSVGNAEIWTNTSRQVRHEVQNV